MAAYAFNEGTGTTVTDSSGNGNNGTIANATWTTAGKYGDALVFNGTNAPVTIPDAASLHLTTGMTLEAWVNPSTVTSAWRDVIYKGNDNYYLEATSTSGGVPAAGATLGSSDVDTLGTAALATSTWTFLTETYNGSALALYVNGTLVSSLAQTGNIVTSTNPLQIGGDSIYGQYFQGMIDEVRVYNVALTAAQIQSDMNTPISSGHAAADGTDQPDRHGQREPGQPELDGIDRQRGGDRIPDRTREPGQIELHADRDVHGTTFSDTTCRRTPIATACGPPTRPATSAHSNVASHAVGWGQPARRDVDVDADEQFTANSTGDLVGRRRCGWIGLSGTITSTGLYTPPTSIGTTP